MNGKEKRTGVFLRNDLRPLVPVQSIGLDEPPSLRSHGSLTMRTSLAVTTRVWQDAVSLFCLFPVLPLVPNESTLRRQNKIQWSSSRSLQRARASAMQDQYSDVPIAQERDHIVKGMLQSYSVNIYRMDDIEKYPNTFAHPGVYIIFKNKTVSVDGPKSFAVVYVGETENVGQRLVGGHHREECFAKHQGQFIGVIPKVDEQQRLDVEDDLIEANQPVCNQQRKILRPHGSPSIPEERIRQAVIEVKSRHSDNS